MEEENREYPNPNPPLLHQPETPAAGLQGNGVDNGDQRQEKAGVDPPGGAGGAELEALITGDQHRGANTDGQSAPCKQHGGQAGVGEVKAVAADTALASAGECSSMAEEQPPGGAKGRIGRLLHWLYPTGFWKEFKHMFALAWPVVVTQILHYTIGTISIIFAGHRGKLELDVIALSTSVLSVTAITVANGLAGYCDTLFAQVYGSKDKEKLGVVLQKCLVIIMLGLFPCLAIHVNLERILLFVGHEHDVARLTEEYVLIFIPGTVGFFCYIVLSKYVQNQNREVPIMIIAFIANVINAVLHGVFFMWLEAGLWMSAMAQSASYASFFFMTTVYIKVSGLYKETWFGWSAECLKSWGPYFKLGVFGLLQHCVEWWAFEAGIILTGPLGSLAIGAQSIIYQMALFLYTIAWGIGLGGGIRTGQFLGAMDPPAAKTSSAVTLTVAVVCGTAVFIFVTVFRNQLPYIFTSEADVVELVASVLPIIAVEEIFDFLAGATNGILRGCGRQVVGMIITIPAFGLVLFIGIPLMLKTSFHIKAFWVSVLVTLFIQALAGTIYLSRLDWTKEAKVAQKRIKMSGGGDHKEKDEIGTRKEDEKGNAEKENNSGCQTISAKIILWRVLAFGLSIGVLILALFLRVILGDYGMQPHGEHPNNTTGMEYIVDVNSTLGGDNGYRVALNGTYGL